MVNGIGLNEEFRVFNGIGCLAAQFIAEFKDGAGGLYMTWLGDEQQYNYEVVFDYESKLLKVRYEKQEYSIDEWIELCKKEE